MFSHLHLVLNKHYPKYLLPLHLIILIPTQQTTHYTQYILSTFHPWTFNNICWHSPPIRTGHISVSSPLLIPLSLIPAFSDIIPFLSFLLEPSSPLFLPHSVLQTKSVSGALAVMGYYAPYVGSFYDVSEQSLIQSSNVEQSSWIAKEDCLTMEDGTYAA